MSTPDRPPTIALCMEYPVAQMGGVEVLVTELLRRLATEFRIVLVSDDTPETLASAGLRESCVAHLPWKFGARRPGRAALLAQALSDHGVGLAHFHFGGTYCWDSRWPGRSPVLHLARRGVPVLSTNHLVHPPLEGYCGPHRPAWFRLGMLPSAWIAHLQILSAVRTEFTVSTRDRDAARRLFWPLARKIELMYHSKLDPACEPPPAPGPREPLILNVGTLGLRKGQILLLEAFDLIADDFPEWSVCCLGRVEQDDYRARLEAHPAYVRRRNRFRIAGFTPEAETVATMRRAAVFAMPSLSEGLGLSLQEALYRGCACVGMAVGGIPDLIVDGVSGLLAEPQSVADLAAKLAGLLRDPDLRMRLARGGQEHLDALAMTAPAMAHRHAERYRAILHC